MNNTDLIREIRKPGKVFVPVVVPGDVDYIVAEKADLVDYLRNRDSNDPAPFMVLKRADEGLYLDVA